MWRVRRLKRLWVYLVDCVIVLIIWTIINNLVSTPAVDRLMQFGAALTSFLYFLLLECPGSYQASIAKRRFRLEVIRFGSLENLRWPQSLARAAIASLGFLPWETATAVPWSVGWFAIQIPLSLIEWVFLYSLVELWRNGSARLPHDILTGTAVVAWNRSHTADPNGGSLAGPPSVIFDSRRLAICLVPILGMFLLSYVNRPTQAELDSATEIVSINQAFSDHIAEYLHLRNVVEISSLIETNTVSGLPSTTRSVLQVEVWIPLVKWSSLNQAGIMRVFANNLELEPGQYDLVKFKLWTGGLLRFGQNYEFPAQ